MLVVRNLLLGCTTFNDIARGLPGISRSLLSQRLGRLEDAGVITTRPKQGRRGREYELTEAGLALWDVIKAMAGWGERWVELQPEHTDPSFVLWAWIHVHLCSERLPRHRVLVQFDFPDQRPPHHRFWMLIEGGAAEMCHAHPGFDCDLEVTARSEAFTRWHVGKIEWGDALRSGDIVVDGSRALARQLPTWNERAVPAG